MTGDLHFSASAIHTEQTCEMCEGWGAGCSCDILDDSLDIDRHIPTEHANLSDKDTKHQM